MRKVPLITLEFCRYELLWESGWYVITVCERSFRTFFDAEQHFPLHDEVRRFKDETEIDEIKQRVLEIGVVVAAPADNETSVIVIDGV